MKVGDIVKWTHPMETGEESARYILVELNDDRGLMQLICDLPLPPLELVRIAEIVVADDGRNASASAKRP